MANNRMYLVNKRTGGRVYLAKYYPSTGWFCPAGVDSRLAVAFDDADFGHLSEDERRAGAMQPGFGPPYSGAGMYGDEWEIEYEVSTDG